MNKVILIVDDQRGWLPYAVLVPKEKTNNEDDLIKIARQWIQKWIKEHNYSFNPWEYVITTENKVKNVAHINL